MTEREQRREQPAKAMREGPQPSRYMSEGRLTIVVVALAILTFLGLLNCTAHHRSDLVNRIALASMHSDRKSTRLNSSHRLESRMQSSA